MWIFESPEKRPHVLSKRFLDFFRNLFLTTYSFILRSSITTGLNGSGQAIVVLSRFSSQGNSPPCRSTRHEGKRTWNADGQMALGSPERPKRKSLLKSNSWPTKWPAAQVPFTETIFKITFSGFAMNGSPSHLLFFVSNGLLKEIEFLSIGIWNH